LDLYVISFLEKDARMKQVEIMKKLRALGYTYSKSDISYSIKKLKPYLYPFMYLWQGLKSSFYLFLETNSIKDTTEIIFLLRYFSNALPLSSLYFTKTSLYVIGAYPPEVDSHIKSVFRFLMDYYNDIDIYTDIIIHGRRLFSNLIPYWDEARQYWIVKPEMFHLDEFDQLLDKYPTKMYVK